MKGALINPYSFAPPAAAVIEDYFDNGWDVARSVMWQEIGKINPADTVGEDINTIEPIVGIEDLNFVGTLRATVNADDTITFPTGLSNKRQYMTGAFTSKSQPFEFWMVMKKVTGQNGWNFIFDATFGTFVHGFGANTQVNFGTAQTFVGITTPDDQTVILRFKVDGASTKVFQDGVESSSGSLNVGANAITKFVLGTNGQNTDWNVYEVWSKDSLLSDADALAATNLLKTEYGI